MDNVQFVDLLYSISFPLKFHVFRIRFCLKMEFSIENQRESIYQRVTPVMTDDDDDDDDGDDDYYLNAFEYELSNDLNVRMYFRTTYI